MNYPTNMRLSTTTLLSLATTALILFLVPSAYAGSIIINSPSTLPINHTQTVTLQLDTQGQAIIGADIVITYNPTIISILQVDPQSSQPFTHFHSHIIENPGQIVIGASFTELNQSATGVINLANLTIKGTSPGTSSLQIACTPNSTTDSNLTQLSTASDILNCSLITTTNILVPSPTPTPSPPPDLVESLTITSLFKGITSNVGPIAAEINIGYPGSIQPLATINAVFLHQSGPTYAATINLSQYQLYPQTKYWITVKGEKHLQRAFTNQTLSITNTLNSSSKPFEPGDLPTQDGEVNNHDLNLILSTFTLTSPSALNLHTADVNYDGAINSLDLSLVLATLSTKPDEANP